MATVAAVTAESVKGSETVEDDGMFSYLMIFMAVVIAIAGHYILMYVEKDL